MKIPRSPPPHSGYSPGNRNPNAAFDEGALALSESQNRIFISIASYRDSQLIPTIRSCIAQAANPDNLRFGICWQHGADETDFPYARDSRFRVLDVPWQDSRGACWARSEIMKEWRGEEWFLQLDSHCRLSTHWDAQLIRLMGETNSSKPVLSTYATAFTPGDNEALEGGPLCKSYLRISAKTEFPV